MLRSDKAATDPRPVATCPIGHTALRVTDLCFGAAPSYGHGLSKRRLGAFRRTRPVIDWVLATKVGRRLEPVALDRIPDQGLERPLSFRPLFDYSYDGIMQSFEHSSTRFGPNRIDSAWILDIGVLTHGDRYQVHLEALFPSSLRALHPARRPPRPARSRHPRRDSARIRAHIIREGAYA